MLADEEAIRVGLVVVDDTEVVSVAPEEELSEELEAADAPASEVDRLSTADLLTVEVSAEREFSTERLSWPIRFDADERLRSDVPRLLLDTATTGAAEKLSDDWSSKAEILS